MEFYVTRKKNDPEDELQHYGILGMKWGIRRYQNPDGSLTEAGRKRRGIVNSDAPKDSATIFNYFQKKNNTDDYRSVIKDVNFGDHRRLKGDEAKASFNKLIHEGKSKYINAITETEQYKDYIDSMQKWDDYVINQWYENPKVHKKWEERLLDRWTHQAKKDDPSYTREDVRKMVGGRLQREAVYEWRNNDYDASEIYQDMRSKRHYLGVKAGALAAQYLTAEEPSRRVRYPDGKTGKQVSMPAEEVCDMAEIDYRYNNKRKESYGMDKAFNVDGLLKPLW